MCVTLKWQIIGSSGVQEKDVLAAYQRVKYLRNEFIPVPSEICILSAARYLYFSKIPTCSYMYPKPEHSQGVNAVTSQLPINN